MNEAARPCRAARLVALVTSAGLMGLSVAALNGMFASQPVMAVVGTDNWVSVSLCAKRKFVKNLTRSVRS